MPLAACPGSPLRAACFHISRARDFAAWQGCCNHVTLARACRLCLHAGILETAKALPTSPAATTILKFTLANGAPTTDTGTHTDTDTQTRTDSVGGKETQTYHTWDFEALRRDYLQALVDALAPLLELRLESQVGVDAHSSNRQGQR